MPAVDGQGIEQKISFTFPISDTSDLVVMTRDSDGVEDTLVETTEYTVDITGDSGGTVTTVTPFVAAGTEIHIIGKTPITQELDLTQGGSFSAEAIEDAFDKLTKIVKENDEKTDRMIKFPDTDPVTSISELPSAPDRAEKYLYFNSDGKPAVLAGVVDTTEIPVSVFMETLLDDTSVDDIYETLELLDENDMSSDSDTRPASQQSIKAFVTSGTVTMTNKTLTSPTITSPTITGTTSIGNGATLTTPVLTSPVINTGVSGTAFLDDDSMATATATTIASSESIKAYVDAQVGYAATGGYVTSSVDGAEVTVYTKYLTGTLESDSSTSVAHGITSALTKILSCQVMCYDNTYSLWILPSASAQTAANHGYVTSINANHVILQAVGTALQGSAYRIKLDFIL